MKSPQTKKTTKERLLEQQQSSLIPKKNGLRTLEAVRPNAGLEVSYRAALNKQIEEMHASVMYWLSAEYKKHAGRIIGDEMPVKGLQRSMRKLSRRWTKNFQEIADKAAPEFVRRNAGLTTQQIMASVKKAGMTVEMRMTQGVRDVVQAAIAENVSLIRSIPEDYFREIEGLVFRSVQHGRDLGYLTEQLQERYHITRSRAALIARDQNNKASAAISRARQLDLGITEAIWMHSSAGKHPRPTHVAMNGKKYDVRKGMWDKAVNRYIQPGEEINCRCSNRPIIPGFS